MINLSENRMITTDFLGNKWDFDCMGCAIAAGSMPVPGGFIRRGRYFVVHQDPLIPLPGFLVIASMRHFQSIDEMEAAEYADFSRLLRETQRAIKHTLPVEALTIVQEEHAVHFHLWFFPWTGALIEQYGPPSLSSIRAIMADFRKQPIGPGEWERLERTIQAIRARLAGSEALHGG
jgi:diadenosine tetraphosphate (Ap4A) HIT family hydrolase